MKRVAVYVRVSTDGQTTDNQIHELADVIARHDDWETVTTFTDNGISGSKGKNGRPGFGSAYLRSGWLSESSSKRRSASIIARAL